MTRVENKTIKRIQSALTVYDFCLAWEWEYDFDFVQILQAACSSQGISLLQVTPHNLDDVMSALHNGEITFHVFLDRASDTLPQFLALIDWARSQDVMRINRYKLARQAWDKAFCHDEFKQHGLNTPPAIVIPSFQEAPDLLPRELNTLGPTFYIKPAHGGGGKGVINQATAWEQVLTARREYPFDQYLLQASITPAELDGKQAWFRILYCGGDIHPSWWDTCTHIYTPFIPAPETQFLEDCFRYILPAIARICKLELFSTEVAYTNQAGCIIVDYINDPVDLRLQSRAIDGVPDPIVAAIAGRIAALAASNIWEKGEKHG